MTGTDFSKKELRELGNKIVTLTRLFNVREGITSKDDNLPRRFFEKPLPAGGSKGITVKKEKFVKTVKEYYELRGWNSKGIPKVTEHEMLEYTKKKSRMKGEDFSS